MICPCVATCCENGAPYIDPYGPDELVIRCHYCGDTCYHIDTAAKDWIDNNPPNGTIRTRQARPIRTRDVASRQQSEKPAEDDSGHGFLKSLIGRL